MGRGTGFRKKPRRFSTLPPRRDGIQYLHVEVSNLLARILSLVGLTKREIPPRAPLPHSKQSDTSIGAMTDSDRRGPA